MADENSIFRRESLERLSSPEQLDQLMQVVNAKSWIPLATLGSLVALALIWSIFGRIPVTAIGKGVLVHPDAADANQLVSLTVFDAADAEKIQPGMQVMIVPDTASQQGSLLGKVTSISGSEITTVQAARDALDADQPEAGTLEVLADLERDPNSTNGYKWSSPDGASRNLTAGTTTITRITLGQKAPIAFVFPFLEAKQ